ncbi:10243_t:CDS:1, partial [Paraglomus occultum]
TATPETESNSSTQIEKDNLNEDVSSDAQPAQTHTLKSSFITTFKLQ